MSFIIIFVLIFSGCAKTTHRVTADKSGCYACYGCGCLVTIDDNEYGFNWSTKGKTHECFEIINEEQFKYDNREHLNLNDEEFLKFQSCIEKIE
mgnify:CR=1 FL=1